VADRDIFPAVVVDIDERGAEADEILADGRDPRDLRAVLKEELIARAVTVEGVKLPFVIGNPDGGQSRAVVVRGVHAHAAVRHAAAVARHPDGKALLLEARL